MPRQYITVLCQWTSLLHNKGIPIVSFKLCSRYTLTLTFVCLPPPTPSSSLCLLCCSPFSYCHTIPLSPLLAFPSLAVLFSFIPPTLPVAAMLTSTLLIYLPAANPSPSHPTLSYSSLSSYSDLPFSKTTLIKQNCNPTPASHVSFLADPLLRPPHCTPAAPPAPAKQRGGVKSMKHLCSPIWSLLWPART